MDRITDDQLAVIQERVTAWRLAKARADMAEASMRLAVTEIAAGYGVAAEQIRMDGRIDREAK